MYGYKCLDDYSLYKFVFSDRYTTVPNYGITTPCTNLNLIGHMDIHHFAGFIVEALMATGLEFNSTEKVMEAMINVSV